MKESLPLHLTLDWLLLLPRKQFFFFSEQNPALFWGLFSQSRIHLTFARPDHVACPRVSCWSDPLFQVSGILIKACLAGRLLNHQMFTLELRGSDKLMQWYSPFIHGKPATLSVCCKLGPSCILSSELSVFSTMLQQLLPGTYEQTEWGPTELMTELLFYRVGALVCIQISINLNVGF